MNQCIVAGLGNIYVNETLYLCKIYPEKLGCKIKDKDIRKLIRVIKKILKNAIIAGGSTINNYHNSEGKTGSYQKILRFMIERAKNASEQVVMVKLEG